MERTTPTPETLARVADLLDDGGIDAVPTDLLAAVTAAARAAGASDVLVAVFDDPAEPPVARERAFAKLVSRIVGHVPTAASITLAA